VAVLELMRLLVDEYDHDWDKAWETTRRTFAYTNHTLLPEALEKWSVELFGRILPRHLEITYEINRRFLDEVRMAFPDEPERPARMSLIDESGERYVRMAHLACVGSHAVNGVAALHTELLKSDVLKDFYALWPEKFSNKTNGVTPRRFMMLGNPGLAALVTRTVGHGWEKNLEQLRQLEAHAEDAGFRQDWMRVKRGAKQRLAGYIKQRTGTSVDPDSLFDIQTKRIHEYKRQHLNVLHVIDLYWRLKHDASETFAPRTVIFGGKAAPSYFMARLIIKLINSVGDMVNRDPATRERLQVVFVPDFSVKTAQHIYPAADLSEQISTAGKEASGTGNMKFSMNGALTIGTLDGANVEIRAEVGTENFFLFGLTAEEVGALRAQGYRPYEYYAGNAGLRHAIDLIASGYFSHGDQNLFRPLVDSLIQHDPYLVLADFQSYVDCQLAVNEAYKDQDRWSRMSILNTARIGKFSSDRAIREYCEDIWAVEPVALGV
jgi:starch phosphorylase